VGARATLGTLLGSPFFWRFILPLILLVVAVKVLMALCLTYVAPNEYGIKVVRVPVLARAACTKTSTTPAFIWCSTLRPRADVSLPERSPGPRPHRHARGSGARSQHQQAAHIQTSDGFFVDVDVSILYKIVDPYLVFTRLGTGRLFEANGIVPKAEPVLKQTLGELTTEEFYNSPCVQPRRRSPKTCSTATSHSTACRSTRWLVRYFRYTEEIQKTSKRRNSKTSWCSRTRRRDARPPRRQAQEDDPGRPSRGRYQAAGRPRLHHDQGLPSATSICARSALKPTAGQARRGQEKRNCVTTRCRVPAPTAWSG